MSMLNKFVKYFIAPKQWREEPRAPDTDMQLQKAVPRGIPACLLLDDVEEQSDFGRQVVMLLNLQPDNWSFIPNLTMFSHHLLGAFEFDTDGHLRHAGEINRVQGAMRAAGQQRVLTGGDQKAIIEAVRFLLTQKMEIGNTVTESGTSQFYTGGVQPGGGKFGDVWMDSLGGVHKHDGVAWVKLVTPYPSQGAAGNPAFTIAQANKNQMLSSALQYAAFGQSVKRDPNAVF